MGRHFTLLPLAGFSSDDGPGFGFRLARFDYDGETIPYTRAFSLQGFFTTKGKWAHQVRGDFPEVRPGSRLEITIRFDKEETANYFADLTDTQLLPYSDDERTFQQIDTYSTVRWIRDLHRPWRIQFRARGGNTRITPHTPSNSVIDLLAPLGHEGGYLIQLESSVRYDTRDDYLNSTRGRLDEIGIEWGIGGGGDYNGGELAVQHRHFKSLTERLIFAQRFWVTYSFGDVPFYEQPKLGSSKTLRGLSADRYRNDARVLVNTELRWLGVRLSKRRHIFGGLNVFGDVGQVFARGEMPSTGDWRLGLGLGLRLYWYSTIVRADYGRSDSDSALYMRFSQIF